MCILTQVSVRSAAQPTLFPRLGPSKNSSALFPFPLPPDKALGQVQSQGWLSLPHHLFFPGLFWPVKALTHHQEVCSGKTQ